MSKFRNILILIVAAFIFNTASASIIGMVFIGQTDRVGIAVEKAKNGDYVFIAERSNNTKMAEIGFVPGNDFIPQTVFVKDGKTYVILSLMYGDNHGLTNSQYVSEIDPSTNRTLQLTNLSADLKSLAQNKELKDKDGKIYAYDDLDGVSFIYHFQEPGAHDASLRSVELLFSDLVQFEIPKILVGEIDTDFKN